MSDKHEVKRRIRRLFQTLVLGSGALATLSACGDSNPQPQTPGTPAATDGGAPAPKQGGSGFW
jgi:hypothetical protein